MEKIQNHEIKDIYRVRDGLLVEIKKYKRLGFYLSSSYKAKIVRGCKGLKILTEDCFDSYNDKFYKKGTYIYEGTPVEPLIDKSLFTYEIKSSGGSISGNDKDIINILEKIENIIKKYK